MTFSVNTLKALEAEGLDLAACIRVLSTVEPKIDTAAEKRKAWDRERKAEKRAEAKSGGMSGGNPPDPAPNEIDILTPTREIKTEAKASSKSPVQHEKLEAIGTCLRVAFPPPLGVTDEQWTAFRGQRRKKLSPHAYTLLCNKLTKLAEDGWPPGDMIDLAIERGWETVFAPRTPNHGQSTSNVTSLRGSRPDPALDMWRAAVADENEENNLRAGPSLPALGSGGP